WMRDADFLAFKKFVREKGRKTTQTWEVVKCAKRGNDVANRMLQRRLGPLIHSMKSANFSLDGEHTPLLFLTLTYDTKKCSASEAWRNIGTELNRFFSSVRKKHGRISALRAFEASGEGYPHVHMLLYFFETTFTYFTHRNKGGRATYRVIDLQRKRFAEMWHSFVDVQAVVDNGVNRLDDVLAYIVKYKDYHLDPVQWNDKELLTMTASWYFRKRQFSVSGDFFGPEFELDKTLSQVGLVTLQLDLEGGIITEITWEFLGMIKGKDLRLKPEQWEASYKDPPPWLDLVWTPHSSRPDALRDMGFK
ncbi:hypothetical protein KAX17_11105, partial [Candidatus Bipolaricaulota bacterium]|nr:hypothetical protein [Candidatus Bipolaricaulota bacterium]